VTAGVVLSAATPGAATRTAEFTASVLATGLGDPYEIVWGPDKHPRFRLLHVPDRYAGRGHR